MERLNIVFTAWFGNEPRRVELSDVMGAGDGIHIHLYVNNYYWGTFFKRKGQWVGPDDLTSDDLMILIDMIEEELKK